MQAWSNVDNPGRRPSEYTWPLRLSPVGPLWANKAPAVRHGTWALECKIGRPSDRPAPEDSNVLRKEVEGIRPTLQHHPGAAQRVEAVQLLRVVGRARGHAVG